MKLFTWVISFCALSILSLPGSCTMPDYHNLPESFWKNALSPKVFNICREKGTEKSGSGTYDEFDKVGTYYCACCGGDYPLFSSKDKFDSKTGWPSFTKPIDQKAVSLVRETRWISRLLGATTEVQCARCGSHLGHVFNDGPKPTGKRYCMNSVALTFTPEGQTPVRTFPEPTRDLKK